MLVSPSAGWLVAFVVSLLAVLVASNRLVVVVEAAGDHYQLAPGLVGLLAALGADGPEITSAFLSLAAGAPAIGLGVIFGSNLFNLAGLLGMPILLSGFVAVQRPSLVPSAAAMILTTIIAALLVLRVGPVLLLEVLVVVTVAAYGWLLVRPLPLEPPRPGRTLPPRGDLDTEERAREREIDIAAGLPAPLRLLVQGVAAMAVIIGGCAVLVNAMLSLAPRFGLPNAVVGTFGLAVLTSLPNVWVAVALARRRRGAVLISAACNSNLINVVCGICLPAVFHAWQPTTAVRQIDIPALVLLTVLAPLLAWRGHGIGRASAAVLLGAYGLFVVVRLSGGCVTVNA